MTSNDKRVRWARTGSCASFECSARSSSIGALPPAIDSHVELWDLYGIKGRAWGSHQMISNVLLVWKGQATKASNLGARKDASPESGASRIWHPSTPPQPEGSEEALFTGPCKNWSSDNHAPTPMHDKSRHHLMPLNLLTTWYAIYDVLCSSRVQLQDDTKINMIRRMKKNLRQRHGGAKNTAEKPLYELPMPGTAPFFSTSSAPSRSWSRHRTKSSGTNWSQRARKIRRPGSACTVFFSYVASKILSQGAHPKSPVQNPKSKIQNPQNPKSKIQNPQNPKSPNSKIQTLHIKICYIMFQKSKIPKIPKIQNPKSPKSKIQNPQNPQNPKSKIPKIPKAKIPTIQNPKSPKSQKSKIQNPQNPKSKIPKSKIQAFLAGFWKFWI